MSEEISIQPRSTVELPVKKPMESVIVKVGIYSIGGATCFWLIGAAAARHFDWWALLSQLSSVAGTTFMILKRVSMKDIDFPMGDDPKEG